MAQKISEIQHIAIKAIQNKADREKKTGKKNSVNDLWDKFNLIMTKFFLLYYQPATNTAE